LDEFVRPGFLGVENLWSHHSKLDTSHDLLITYPSKLMTMWPISTRVNKPEKDRVVEPIDWQAPLPITSEA
jgi:hypothetical protein